MRQSKGSKNEFFNSNHSQSPLVWKRSWKNKIILANLESLTLSCITNMLLGKHYFPSPYLHNFPLKWLLQYFNRIRFTWIRTRFPVYYFSCKFLFIRKLFLHGSLTKWIWVRDDKSSNGGGGWGEAGMEKWRRKWGSWWPIDDDDDDDCKIFILNFRTWKVFAKPFSRQIFYPQFSTQIFK